MQFRFAALAFLVFAVTLAGCAEEGTAAPEAPQEFSEDVQETLVVTEETGIIRGIVLTETIQPIGNATVALVGTEFTTQTNDKGEFGFGDLDPGAYFMAVDKIGFNATQTSTTVEAGVADPTIVKIYLQVNPSEVPYFTKDSWTGYLQCGAGIPGVGSLNPCAFSGSDNVHNFATGNDMEYVQTEAHWEGTNVLGDGLSMGYLRPGTLGNYMGAQGGSPLAWGGPRDAIVAGQGEPINAITVRSFPSTSSPSVLVDQFFDVYHIVFYKFSPDEGWTFIGDGNPEIPT